MISARRIDAVARPLWTADADPASGSARRDATREVLEVFQDGLIYLRLVIIRIDCIPLPDDQVDQCCSAETGFE